MRYKDTWVFPFTGGLVLIGLSLLLVSGTVEAQCGSQASSCKTCHEVQKELPVNADGTGWHESHAFGDFCIMCHAGNEQATEIEAAHTGMVPPLADIKTACQQCHPNDTTERAQVYASVLGIEIGTSNDSQLPTSAPTTSASTDTPATPQPAVSTPVSEQPANNVPANNEIVVDDPNVVDYVQRYNEIVLGERPINVGNIFLIVMIGLVVVAGGGFVILNELRLSSAAAAMKKVEGEYPAEVVEMLPAIAGLNAGSRSVLKQLLKHLKSTDRVPGAIDTIVSDDSTQE
jgi:hypothetical protein